MEIVSKEESEMPKRSHGREAPPRPGTEPQGFPASDPSLPAPLEPLPDFARPAIYRATAFLQKALK